ncbi:MAG TPA: hypothetical protein VFS48_04750 [Solirubrobacterales bacterium]|nr:hypothetical protein [Solirubrobacterales bacterium]
MNTDSAFDTSLRRPAIALVALLGTTLLIAATALSEGQAKVGPKKLPGSGKAKVGAQAVLTQGRTTVGFWAGEAIPGTDWESPGTYWNRRDTNNYTPYLWRVLSRYRIPLYFNLRYKRDFGPVPAGRPHRNDALPIIRKANRLGVPVWGWVLIPYSDGYWAWEGAAVEQFKAVKALVRWARAKRVRLRGLVLDPEPPPQTPFETRVAIRRGEAHAGFQPALEQAIDPLGQCAAWDGYMLIQRWAARNHVTLATAPSPLALDDAEDGNLALQDAAGFIVPKAPWHAVFFQAYRSAFAYYAGRDPGPGIISSYFHSAQREFGSRGQVSLGSAGRGRYERFSTLLHDVRLAATLGARDLPIYSLERTLRAYGGPRSLIRIVEAAQRPFTGDKRAKASGAAPRATELRAAIRNSDAAAAAATPAITARRRGTPQAANSWPNACSTPTAPGSPSYAPAAPGARVYAPASK